MTTLAVLAALVIAYGAISRLVAGSILTGPILFTGAGLVLGAGGLGVLDLDFDEELVTVLGEATLVLLLFTDAARIEIPRLRRQAVLPVRMLASLPLVIAFGTGLALLILPDLGVFAAAVLASVIAPTDAALGQVVVTDTRIPLRIRQTLNVESGLNDGVVLPFVTIFLGLAGAEEGVSSLAEGVRFVATQVGVALLAGLLIGCAAAWVIDRASAAGWMSEGFQQLATLASAGMIFVVAESFGGNGFIAAFVGGLAFGALAAHCCAGLYDFAEREGSLLALVVFAVLGAALVPELIRPLDWPTAGFVVLALTVVRMVPIAISLLGTGLRRESVAFLGWFGPRGLATILFGLLVVSEADIPEGEAIISVALWTVLASVVAHGVTATPFTAAYTRSLGEMHDDMAEMGPTVHFPTRTGMPDR